VRVEVTQAEFRRIMAHGMVYWVSAKCLIWRNLADCWQKSGAKMVGKSSLQCAWQGCKHWGKWMEVVGTGQPADFSADGIRRVGS
jgi:hypothetical protein